MDSTHTPNVRKGENRENNSILVKNKIFDFLSLFHKFFPLVNSMNEIKLRFVSMEQENFDFFIYSLLTFHHAEHIDIMKISQNQSWVWILRHESISFNWQFRMFVFFLSLFNIVEWFWYLRYFLHLWIWWIGSFIFILKGWHLNISQFVTYLTFLWQTLTRLWLKLSSNWIFK